MHSERHEKIKLHFEKKMNQLLKGYLVKIVDQYSQISWHYEMIQYLLWRGILKQGNIAHLWLTNIWFIHNIY